MKWLILLLALLVPCSLALPDSGTPIVIPPPISYNGLKQIPDAEHPFIAPGPNDRRGPCPGLNTLANHGYLPRSGIVTFADLVTASQEGLAFDYKLSLLASALAILTRGNSLVNLVSIGVESPLIPPLPGRIDGGQVPGGLAKHGRFEGDSSISRDDFGVTGNDFSFSAKRFATLVEKTNTYGNGTIVNLRAIQETKFQNFLDSQSTTKQFGIDFFRRTFMYGEAAFVTQLFANGTDGITTLDAARSFFKDNRFPPNFFRRPNPFSLEDVARFGQEILAPYLIPIGHNDKNGKFVFDTYTTTGNPLCDLYNGLLNQVPATFVTATGQLKTNIDSLLESMRAPFPCAASPPTGPAGT